MPTEYFFLRGDLLGSRPYTFRGLSGTRAFCYRFFDTATGEVWAERVVDFPSVAYIYSPAKWPEIFLPIEHNEGLASIPGEIIANLLIGEPA